MEGNLAMGMGLLKATHPNRMGITNPHHTMVHQLCPIHQQVIQLDMVVMVIMVMVMILVIVIVMVTNMVTIMVMNMVTIMVMVMVMVMVMEAQKASMSCTMRARIR